MSTTLGVHIEFHLQWDSWESYFKCWIGITVPYNCNVVDEQGQLMCFRPGRRDFPVLGNRNGTGTQYATILSIFSIRIGVGFYVLYYPNLLLSNGKYL